jgi:excisionase family DNA binding protein
MAGDVITREGRSALMSPQRFLTLADVAEVLNISASQTYALVRSGELEAIKVGGRGQWRVEQAKLESYIQRMYDQTRQFVAEHPFDSMAATSAD